MGLTDSCRVEVALSNRFKAPQRQYFPLPFGIISYITQNPISAEGLLKLQKTCKYFFSKNKIIPIGNVKLIVSENDGKSHGWINCKSGKKYYFNDNIKWWLTNGLTLGYEMVSLLHVYRCNLEKLKISNKSITSNEFNFLSNGNKIKHLALVNVNIRDDNQVHLTIDKVLKNLSNLEKLNYFCPEETFTKETFEKMDLLKFNSKFKSFDLIIFKLSNDADVSLLSQFISKNAGNCAYFCVYFLKIENKGHYLTTLKTAVDKAFQNWNTENKPEIVIY